MNYKELVNRINKDFPDDLFSDHTDQIMIAIATDDPSRGPASLQDSENWIQDAWADLDQEQRALVNRYRKEHGFKLIGQDAKQRCDAIIEQLSELSQCQDSRRYLEAIRNKIDVYYLTDEDTYKGGDEDSE